MSNAVPTYTLIVVSHADLRRHEYASELINIPNYKQWKRPYHECIFTPSGTEDIDSQMQQTVCRHANKFSLEYELHPSETFDVYPFVERDGVTRPSDTTWTPIQTSDATPEFIYVSPAVIGEEGHSLLFVKSGDGHEVNFEGVMRFYGSEHIIKRSQQIRLISSEDNHIPFQLLDIFALTQYLWVDASQTFDEMGLKTGTILVLYSGPTIKASRVPAPIPWKRYRPHIMDDSNRPSPYLVQELYQQAIMGHHTDVVITSASTTDNSFEVNTHRAVLVTVPYFRTMFASGPKESLHSPVVTLEAPVWVEKQSLEMFLSYLYMRQDNSLAKLTVESLTNLIRLADYYSFDQLSNSALEILEDKFYQLTDVNVIELLKVLDSLESEGKASFLVYLAGYVVCNFSRMMQNAGFINLFGTDVYRSLVSEIEQQFRAAHTTNLYY